MKRAFNIVANVCTIVLMGIMFIGSIILVSAAGAVKDSLSALDGDLAAAEDAALGLVKTIAIIVMIFDVATIIVSAFALAKGNHKPALGLKIAVIVLVGVVAILEFVGQGYVYGILCLIPIGFEIASICVKEEQKPAPETAAQQPAAQETAKPEQTIDDKIAELKHLKEIKALTDEQYDTAFKALMEEVK